MVKLFSKSFVRRRLFEKRRHPKTFNFYQQAVSRQSLIVFPLSVTCRGRPRQGHVAPAAQAISVRSGGT
ncbi:hypothetical protein C3920_12490 [Novacetimonas pomaceti]|uniref:Uncharacterized protein n=1 Tax=Novacetimonas pomaceti TaxID=2021998 RepID=A0ABX5NZK9_9PROT|nr:hypothetical protein C3920_12490 [Novacetimonas pomaceti]